MPKRSNTIDITPIVNYYNDLFKVELRSEFKKVPPEMRKKVYEDTITREFYEKYKPNSYRRTYAARKRPIKEVVERDEVGFDIEPAFMTGAYRQKGKVTDQWIYERTLQGIHGFTMGEIWVRSRIGETAREYEMRSDAAYNRRSWMNNMEKRKSKRYSLHEELRRDKRSKGWHLDIPQSAPLIPKIDKAFNAYLNSTALEEHVRNALTKTFT